MTDRELLEKAAKVVEIAHVDYTGIDYDGRLGLQCVDHVGRHTYTWNPLTDDGDAFRLAVLLGERFPCCVVGMFNRAAFAHASASVVHRDGSETYIEQENGDEDVGAAARRAIVRAAAAIGEQS